jgi:hypothetical protein
MATGNELGRRSTDDCRERPRSHPTVHVDDPVRIAQM